jgi:hypothetical protein
MDQPIEFVIQGNTNRVCKLQKKKKKTLYGLREGPKQ